MRKHTLEYDDVMNKQRQEIYAFRNELLHTEDVESLAVQLIESVCDTQADHFFRTHNEENGWDPEGYREWLHAHFPINFPEGFFADDLADKDQLASKAAEKIIAAFKIKLAKENAKVQQRPGQKDSPFFLPANEAARNLMVRKIDQSWQEHLLRMDHLRTDVNLRVVGNRDPLLEFKNDAFAFFDEFSRNVRGEIAQDLFRFEIVTRPPSIHDMLVGLQTENNRAFSLDKKQ